MIQHPPIPANEIERLLSLSELDLDYLALESSLTDLTQLAAKIAGTSISLINLIDTYTQWSVSRHGIPLDQMPREDSVCQYTIMQTGHYEVKDLALDERFNDKDYVVGDAQLRYYFGVPLTTEEGQNIGALCVLDKNTQVVAPEKIELLKIVATEIVGRLKSHKVFEAMKCKLDEMTEAQNKLAHDIRGPIGGMIGLSQLFKNQGNGSEVAEVFNMIEEGGKSILVLAEEILNSARADGHRSHLVKHHQYNMVMLKDIIEKLYQPMARNKGIDFSVNIDAGNAQEAFCKEKLLQVCGNLISNAMKFTPKAGTAVVTLSLLQGDPDNILHISVKDSGIGLKPDSIYDILKGTAYTTNGTNGEAGYGFGLPMVKKLVDELEGELSINSKPNEGATFDIWIPQKRGAAKMRMPDFSTQELAN